MENLLPIQLQTKAPFGFVDRSPAVDFYVQKLRRLSVPDSSGSLESHGFDAADM